MSQFILDNLKRDIKNKKVNNFLQFKSNTNVKNNNINKIIKKSNSDNVIPLNIYQTWHDKSNLPSSVANCISNIKTCNPLFTHHLYDQNECRDFIKNNFPSIVLDTYDILIPHAFKADLWRYCVLYIKGGVYLDVKYMCINNFSFIKLTDKEYFCKDLDSSLGGIYNAIIICKPKNEILLKSIYKIVENASKEYYGQHPLYPTGPLMMKQFFSVNEINNLNLKLEFKNTVNSSDVDMFISFNKFPILFFNKKYRSEQPIYDKHWLEYWNDRNIYDIKSVKYLNVKKYNKNELMENIFTKIYDECIWGNNKNLNYNGSSGHGSSIEINKNTYVPFLINFITNNNIKTVIDLGCGDFICGPLIYDNFSDIKYYGYDIYGKLITYNKQKYHSTCKYNFIKLDFYNNPEEIINGDLYIIKDVIIHWSLNAIYTFLDYLIERKKVKYILLCYCCQNARDNADINTGEWRPLSYNQLPLKKYNPKKIYNYDKKEVSLIEIV